MTEVNQAIKYNSSKRDIVVERDEQAIEDGEPGVDLATVSGKEATIQGVDIALRTRRGELAVSPHIGLPVPRIVGLFDPEFIAGVVRREVKNDPRIRSVQVDAEERTNEQRRKRVITLTVNATTITGEDLELVLEVMN